MFFKRGLGQVRAALFKLSPARGLETGPRTSLVSYSNSTVDEVDLFYVFSRCVVFSWCGAILFGSRRE